MRKISYFIFISIAMTVFFITLLITLNFENTVLKVLDQTTRDNMALQSQQYAIEFNNELESVEKQADEVAGIVASTFDMEAYKSDDTYFEKYLKLIDPIIESFAQSNHISKSTYVFFVPELDNQAHDIWYADLDNNGTVERQESFPLSYYDGDMYWKQWFYIPIQTKKPYWTEPYIGTVDADRDIVYVSYTRPIIVDGQVIAVAGSDYYLTQMKEKIKSYKFKQTGYATLMNRSDQFLIHPTIAEGVNLKDVNEGEFIDIAKSVRQKTNGFLEYKWIQNEDKLMYFSRLRNDWVMMMTLEKKELLSEISHLKLIRLIIFFLAASISGFVAFVVSRRITKPIQVSIQAINDLKVGNYDGLDLNPFMNRRDELGELVNGIESVRVIVQETINKFKMKEAHFESEVSERLEELSKTNNYLEVTLAQLQEQHSELILSEERMSTANQNVKAIEKKLIETEKRAAMTYLVNGLSQDLNSPIGSSMTLISFLKSETLKIQKLHLQKSLNREEFEDFMKSSLESYDLLLKSLTTASELVSQFRKMGLDRSGDLNTAFRVNEFVEMIFNSMKAYHPHHQIKLLLLSKELLIIGNQGAFSQLLTNLIENTILHGYQDFEKGLIQIQFEKIDDYSVLMTYEDFGVGVNQHILDQMFVPYYSINGARETGGIGLNIVYHLVTKVFGGSISADEHVESGVKYYIVLKVALPEQLGLN